MTPGPLDACLRELARALQARGHEPSRLVAEAREHLVDAVEDGLQRGLAREDAEREAVNRFGPPELVAAQAFPRRHPVMARLTAALDTVVGHWRWITAATALAALLTSVASYYWLPTRYRSETLILVSKPGIAGAADAGSRQSLERLQTISNIVLSGPRLEGVAKDFGLGAGVQQMRRNISFEVTPAGEGGMFKVGFQSPDPRVAMRVTERIAGLFIQENLERTELVADGNSQFLDAEILDVRFRLAEMEAQLHARRAQKLTLPRADVIPFEVLQKRYRDLLEKREDVRSTTQLRRRSVGEQYRILEAARVPDRPVGPSHASVNAGGMLAGLILAVGAAVLRRTDPLSTT